MSDYYYSVTSAVAESSQTAQDSVTSVVAEPSQIAQDVQNYRQHNLHHHHHRETVRAAASIPFGRHI